MTVARGTFASGLLAVALAGVALGVVGLERRPARGAAKPVCPQPSLSALEASRIDRALRARTDVWGNALLASPGGPTYEQAARFLAPLLLARAPGKKALTRSGVHYVAFAQPAGAQGAGAVALHVADGSEIIAERVGGRRLETFVGADGLQRFGGCLARLTGPRLAHRYMPVLQTGYVDGVGARYRQESFAAGVPETRSLVSFVRLTVDARAARRPVQVRFRPSTPDLRRSGEQLVRDGATFIVFEAGGRFDRASVVFDVRRGGIKTVHVAWLNSPQPTPLRVDRKAYEAARASVIEHWTRRLAEGAQIVVPDARVLAAARALLVQNLVLTWRYSIGNPYEQFSFPEGPDVAQVLGEWGFADVQRAILKTSLTRRPDPYANWKRGQKLLGSAVYYRLFRDRAYVDEATPVLRQYVAAFARQLERSPRRLLDRERYSSDIAESVYGLHSQAVAWQGLGLMAQVWAETGHRPLARQCARLAARLEVGLRSAVRASQRRLPDGSLFIPASLLAGEQPYGSLTEARLGSYWNLVMPYALASGLFRPGSAEAEGALRYMLRHGSRLLGLVRAGAYALYRDPVFPTSGTDQVYGVNVARFLADADEPDLLVLSLYGALAAAMTPGTFVAGEAASVAPLDGGYYRAMYLPPNSASNAAFLATLRLMLVHETAGPDGEPRGLELAFATPRLWLRHGRRIDVRRVPTSFGPVSYSIRAGRGAVRVRVDVPQRPAPRSLRLRLRLPDGRRLVAVIVDRRRTGRFDRRSATIDLSGRRGRIDVVAVTAA